MFIEINIFFSAIHQRHYTQDMAPAHFILLPFQTQQSSLQHYSKAPPIHFCMFNLPLEQVLFLNQNYYYEKDLIGFGCILVYTGMQQQ